MAPSAKVPTARVVFTLALTSDRLDFFFHNLPCQQAGNLRVMLEKLELHVDRLVEKVLK
ncbi:hypothetical protein [Salinibacter ruber]|uniref:hypothetical protein n=1 Tax=Salinibacter ruber TaxID=146919 RepID=UPI0016226EEF|nr:hypothetical protein [Salinibacter ruber]MBB4070324.1 hypothetical protein [Salinibacter ruber]